MKLCCFGVKTIIYIQQKKNLIQGEILKRNERDIEYLILIKGPWNLKVTNNYQNNCFKNKYKIAGPAFYQFKKYLL